MLTAMAVLALACSTAPSQTVTVNARDTHQTILGWGSCNDWVPFPDDDGPGEVRHIPEWLKLEMIDDAVNVLGMNRLRVQGQYRGREWEPVNDNYDPNDINWGGSGPASWTRRCPSSSCR